MTLDTSNDDSYKCNAIIIMQNKINAAYSSRVPRLIDGNFNLPIPLTITDNYAGSLSFVCYNAYAKLHWSSLSCLLF